MRSHELPGVQVADFISSKGVRHALCEDSRSIVGGGRTLCAAGGVAQAPGEAEVSIYVDGGGKFIELETYGAYGPMPNGLWTSWTTTWFLRKLPGTIAATVGNQALVDWVRSVIQ